MCCLSFNIETSCYGNVSFFSLLFTKSHETFLPVSFFPRSFSNQKQDQDEVKLSGPKSEKVFRHCFYPSETEVMVTQNFQSVQKLQRGQRVQKPLRRDQLPLKTNAPLNNFANLHLGSYLCWLKTIFSVYIHSILEA